MAPRLESPSEAWENEAVKWSSIAFDSHSEARLYSTMLRLRKVIQAFHCIEEATTVNSAVLYSWCAVMGSSTLDNVQHKRIVRQLSIFASSTHHDVGT